MAHVEGRTDLTARIDGDAPTERDDLGREPYVEALARIVETAETPLVLAVYGAWGSGKTSMMMQLRRKIDPTHDGKGTGPGRARTVWFDPWMHQFDDSPALGLLHAAADQLGVARQRNVIEALSKIAIAVGEDIQIPFVGIRIGKLLKIRQELAQDDFNRREERARFRAHFHSVLKAMGAGQQRVVFFIDDLDRCQPPVALSLLEALKLYLDLPGCVYVLGVDREPLEAAVGAQYRELGLRTESYLDKIIQLPFSIPAIGEEAMDSFVTACLPDELKMCAEMLAAASADEPRNVKRLANSLLVNHELATTATFADGYDPRILTLVVLIQNRAPDLYRQLRLDPSLIHQLFEEDPPSDGTTADSAEQPSLWDLYVAENPRLEKALKLVELPPNVDLTPYITLTSIATVVDPSPEGASVTGAGRVYLSYRRADSRGWSKRIADSLRELGWEVFEDTGMAPGDDYQKSAATSLAMSNGLVLLIGRDFLVTDSDGRPRLANPDDHIRTEILEAESLGLPIIPVLIDSAEVPPVQEVPSELQFIARLNALPLDAENYSLRIAELDRTLRRTMISG